MLLGLLLAPAGRISTLLFNFKRVSTFWESEVVFRGWLIGRGIFMRCLLFAAASHNSTSLYKF